MGKTTSTVNMVMHQGTDFSATFDVFGDDGLPLNLLSHTARSQMRPHYESNTAYPFSCVTFNGGITISMNAAVTSTVTARRYVYDVELVAPDTQVTRPIRGMIKVIPEVSK